MTDNKNVPPKVEQQARPPKAKSKPHEPWWAWAGIAFGAALVLQGFSDLLFMLSGINLDDLVIIPFGLLVMAALTCACAGFPPRLPKPGAERPPKSNSKPYGIIAVCTLACGMFLMMAAMMIPAIHAAREAAAEAEAGAGQWKEHVFGNGKFSVTTPASWRPGARNPNAGELQLANPTNDLVLAATTIPKMDVSVNSRLELTELGLAGIEQRMDDVQAEEPMESHLNGFSVVDTTGKATAQGANLHFQLRYIDFGDTWVELVAWSTPSKFGENRDTFGKILDSVEVHR